MGLILKNLKTAIKSSMAAILKCEKKSQKKSALKLPHSLRASDINILFYQSISLIVTPPTQS
jgi:hypothetical protein